MRVYHGSYVKIDNIDLTKSKPNKDFGKGFYITKFRHHADYWAKTIGVKYGTEGYVSEFEFTENEFTKSICNIKHFETYDEEWLDFIVKNRDKNNTSHSHDYDIVIGPVANDKVQTTLRFYLKGKISKIDFLKMLSFHEETHQICFCTLKSLQTIDKVDEPPTFEVVTITEPIINQLTSDLKIDERKASDLFFSSETYEKLNNQVSKLFSKNWKEIYNILLNEIK